MGIQFTTEHFTRHLTNLGLGMLAIIIVIGLIIVITMALIAITKKQMSKNTTVLVSVLAIAILGGLIGGLYFADRAENGCATCLKKGEYSVKGILYCEDHYEEYMEAACVKCDNPGDHEIGGVKFCEKHFNEMLGLNCDAPECDKKHTHRVEIAPDTGIFAQFCDDHYEEYLESLKAAE